MPYILPPVCIENMFLARQVKITDIPETDQHNVCIFKHNSEKESLHSQKHYSKS